MAGEQERVDGYLATVDRLEPDIHPIDANAFYASAAISAKRTADATERAADAIVEYIAWLKDKDAIVQKIREQMKQQTDAVRSEYVRPDAQDLPIIKDD